MSDNCNHCGKKLEENAIYCSSCGRRKTVKKFLRSDRDCKILGLCGGLGDYFQVDSNLVRLIVALVIFWSGIVPGLIIYFILGVVIPSEEDVQTEK